MLQANCWQELPFYKSRMSSSFFMPWKWNGGIEMKGFLSQKQVETIKEQYPVGTRIELIHMDDPYGPIEAGTQGTVEGVDDAGTYG